MPIDVYFLRHGVAAERGAGIPDAERPLTAEGRRKMIQAALGMRRLGLRFEALISSPLLRARQTAELVKRRLPFRGRLEIAGELEPSGALGGVLDLLRSRREGSFLLVGHEPALSAWIAGLLGCGRAGAVEMKKGALCHIRLDRAEAGSPAELAAHFPPKALRRLGAGK